MTLSQDIHFFWFDHLSAEDPVPPDRNKLWFGGAGETVAVIRDLFADAVSRAAAGEYDGWAETPRGALALILLLDQFPRNIYRKTPQAFATDAKALSICLAGIAAGLDSSLQVVERAFFYLPMEHSEDIEIQKRSLVEFAALINDASPAQRGICESYYDYAVRHHEIIARFGRFPHRNETLGRRSTVEEIEFLKEPGSSF